MATLNLQVGASTDDAFRRLLDVAYWLLTHALVVAGAVSATVYEYGSGMRFLSITIAQADTIDTAYLTLRAETSRAGTVVNSRISAEDVDDAATFADNAAAFDTRWAARTTARVDWDAIAAWTADTDYNSPEIKAVIQEIVDRALWASGNDMVIFWEDFENRSTITSGNPFRTAHSWDGNTTLAPKLHIEYTAGGGGQTYSLDVSDGLKAGESISTRATFGMSITDGLKGGEVLGPQSVLGMSIADGMLGGETLSSIYKFPMSLSDGLTTGDSLTWSQVSAMIITEAMLLGELITMAIDKRTGGPGRGGRRTFRRRY